MPEKSSISFRREVVVGVFHCEWGGYLLEPHNLCPTKKDNVLVVCPTLSIFGGHLSIFMQSM